MKNNITETSHPDFIIKTPDDYISQINHNIGMYRYTNLNNEKIFGGHSLIF